jgi:hypothetical protein
VSAAQAKSKKSGGRPIAFALAAVVILALGYFLMTPDDASETSAAQAVAEEPTGPAPTRSMEDGDISIGQVVPDFY